MQARRRSVAWLQRLPRPLRWLALPALLAFAVVAGPDLIAWRPAQAPTEPARLTEAPALPRAAGPGDAEAGEWSTYAALEPAVSGGDLVGEAPATAPEAGSGEAGTPSILECIIEPNQVVAIGSPVTGRIEAIHVDRSDPVEVDQPLVSLESSVEKAAVEVARARAEMDGHLRSRQAAAKLGERKEQRALRLYEQNALSLDLKEEAETQAELARRELQQAREARQLAALELREALEALQRRTIQSPVSGLVLDRLMAPGEVVDDETILRVAEVHPLRVEVILPSAMFGSIQPGMRGAVTPEVPGDEVHVAEVTLVDRVIDAASGTFGVRLELPNPDHAIPGGLHCQVRFLTE